MIWEHFGAVQESAVRAEPAASEAARGGAPQSPRPADVSTEWLIRNDGRPLFIFAHQDDEAVIAGTISRIVKGDRAGTFVWWTNGDGLAPSTGENPTHYAQMRVAEAEEVVRRLGASKGRKIDLWSSEIENYRRFTHVAAGGELRARAIEYFLAEADRVEAAVRKADPDRVFLLAWQGGHPEHDLTHLMTVRAVRRLRRETGRPIPIVQCPAYEYIILCALRFKPWFKGDRRRIVLTPEERDLKRSIFDAYPSQQDLFRAFQKVVKVVGVFSALRGKPLSVDTYLGEEELGVIEPDLDYTISTHWPEAFNYINDDFEGLKIRFDTMIAPLASAILGS